MKTSNHHHTLPGFRTSLPSSSVNSLETTVPGGRVGAVLDANSGEVAGDLAVACRGKAEEITFTAGRRSRKVWVPGQWVSETAVA